MQIGQTAQVSVVINFQQTPPKTSMDPSSGFWVTIVHTSDVIDKPPKDYY